MVVARATASEWEDDSRDPGPGGLVGVNTRFSVSLTLKGEAPKAGPTVLHFQWGKARSNEELERRARNPPNLVHFRTEALRVEVCGAAVDVPAPDYLLFLKKRPDGRYEPVSGQTDLDQSVRELFGGLSKDLTFAHDHRPSAPDPAAARLRRHAVPSMAYVAVLNPRALVIRHAPGVILDRDKRLLLAPDIGEATAVRVAFPAFSPAGEFETDADDLRDRAAGRRAVAGEVVARDQRCGLTLIRLDRDPPSSARAARLADRVEVGAPVWRLGVRVPEGRELWEVAEGRVQSVGREAGPGRAAGSAAGRPREIVTKLDSGADAEGPLFDRRGAVLGFSRSTDDLHRTQAFVHVDEIREFLRVNKVELPPASGPEKK